MNLSSIFPLRPIAAVLTVCALTVACSASPTRPQGADAARDKLTQLQSDAQLASRAPVAIREAESAVAAAEVPRKDAALGHHLVVIADRKVDIAAAQAESRLLEDQRKTLSEQRERARLDARTREADQARGEVRSARAQVSSARQQTDDLQRQLDLLNARETDRGQVITLGDLLFATGKSDLKGGAAGNLGKLAQFLNQYEDRSVTIEGYTDSVGSEEFNRGLSQRRADSVKTYLVKQGVAANRLHSSGKGMSAPVSDNDTATGRQQNRRVEVIISNPAASAG